MVAAVCFDLFNKFREEGDLIGRIVVSYGELENLLTSLVGAVLSDDDMAARMMFRIGGGSGTRIEVADAILSAKFQNGNLAGPYSEFIGALRYCKKIRNQFAHAQWIEDNGRLMFGSFEENAKSVVGELATYFKPIHLSLLQKQKEWFAYTSVLAHWVNLRQEWEAAGSATPPPPAPPRVLRPTLYSQP